MLAVNPYVKTAPRRSGTRAPLPLPSSGVVGASLPGAGPTSPTGSAARRGRLHIQSGRGTVEQQSKERKATQQQFVDANNSDGSGSDSGYDSPVDRPRRRFVKPTVTTYETCFSRQAAAGGGSGASGGRRFNRRPGAGPRVGLASYSFLNSTSSASLALAAAAAPSADDTVHQLDTVATGSPPTAQGVRRAPAVSSLSSVLQELMHGRQRALSSYVDATAPQVNPRTFVVQQDGDGALFVASSTGERFAADSAMGRALLQQPAPVRTTTAPADTTLPSDVPSLDRSGSMQRADLDVSRVQRTPQSVRQSLARRENSASDSSSSSGPSSSKSKLLGFASLKSKLAARRSERASCTSLSRSGDDRPMTLDEIDHTGDADAPAVLGASASSHLSNSSSGGSLTFHISSADDYAVPMLDPDLVDARARGDSGWEVPASAALKPTAVDKSQIVNRPIPFANDVDDDDDDDNLLNRSFLNVRDIEFHPRTDKDAAPVSVPAAVLESAGCDDESETHVSMSPVTDRATFDDDDDSANRPSAAARDSYASRGSSLSAGRASVSEFLGGYKGQLSTRRTSMGHDGSSGAFVNRARSVRHGARRSAAANAAATALTRKLREARNRIPFEFRDDLAPPGKASKSSSKRKKLRVRWDLTPYVREFEVESEDEADAAEAAIVKAPWEYKDGEPHESDDDDDDDDASW